MIRYMLAILAALGTCGCGSGLDAVQQAEVYSYGQGQIECVVLASTRAQADQCRNAVRESWCGPGRPLQEAGACSVSAASVTVVTVLDGGAR